MLQSPEIQQQIAAEGKRVDEAVIAALKEEVKVEYHAESVPATLPEHSGAVLVVKEPEPKKRGRKPKENPVNGRDIASEGGITQADVENAGKPAPTINTEANKAEAEAFVESLDPAPTKEEMAGFAARTRALVAVGAVSSDLKNYT